MSISRNRLSWLVPTNTSLKSIRHRARWQRQDESCPPRHAALCWRHDRSDIRALQASTEPDYPPIREFEIDHIAAGRCSIGLAICRNAPNLKIENPIVVGVAMLIAQITDLHAGLIVDTGDMMIDTNQQVSKAVRHLNQFKPTPKCVVVTGDLVGDGTERQYRDVKSQLDELLMPCYLIPGNHDDRDLVRAIFADHAYLPKASEFLHYVIGDFPVRLIGLDTLVPGQEAGLLCKRRLDWIRTQLSEGGGQPTLIFMHHPPFVTGIPAFDDMACGNGAKLGAIVDQHPEVIGVLAGHVHRPISVAWHGTSVHVAPSVSFQYPLALARVRELIPLPEPAACGIYRWSPDAGLRAHLSYINH